jgi:hypothetical protein
VLKKPCGNQQSTKLIELNLCDRHPNSGAGSRPIFSADHIGKKDIFARIARMGNVRVARQVRDLFKNHV